MKLSGVVDQGRDAKFADVPDSGGNLRKIKGKGL